MENLRNIEEMRELSDDQVMNAWHCHGGKIAYNAAKVLRERGYHLSYFAWVKEE